MQMQTATQRALTARQMANAHARQQQAAVIQARRDFDDFTANAMTQDIRSSQSNNPMAGYQNYLNFSHGLQIGSQFQNNYKQPEPTIQAQITDWEAKLDEAATHPPSKHRDAAIDACHEMLALLDDQLSDTTTSQ
jgi:hypothetical protein